MLFSKYLSDQDIYKNHNMQMTILLHKKKIAVQITDSTLGYRMSFSKYDIFKILTKNSICK